MTVGRAPTDQATVVVSSRSFSSGERDLDGELAAAGLRTVRVGADHDPRELLPALADASAWIAGTSPVTAEQLAAAPRLRVIARHGVGVESVDLAAAAAAGVTVTNTPGANSEAVSELTVALVLAALRGVAAGDRRVRTGDWSVRRGRQLAGAVAGVVGFGRIGRGTASRLTGLGCRILVADPYVDDDAVRAAGAEPVALAELRRRADVVALHAPGGSVIVDAGWTADCRPGQLVVNTARADLVDEPALAAALADGRIAGYAADTLAAEFAADTAAPTDAAGTGGGSPLLDPQLADLVTVTPHLGAQTVQAVDAMGGMAVADVLAVLAGRAPAHPVPPAGSGPGWPPAASTPAAGPSVPTTDNQEPGEQPCRRPH